MIPIKSKDGDDGQRQKYKREEKNICSSDADASNTEHCPESWPQDVALSEEDS